MKEKEIIVVKEHKSEFCDKLFQSAVDLKTHIKGVHDSSKDQICNICTKSYSTKSELINHIKMAHNKKNKNVIE